MVGSAPHWKWRFTCFWRRFLWNFAVSFFVAGAVFGEFGGWHLLLRALEMRWGLSMWVFLRDRTIAFGESQVSLFVAGAVFVWSSSVTFPWQAQYLVKVKCHFSWQVQYLVKFKCHFSWQAQYLVSWSSVTFRGRRSTWWMFQCKIGQVRYVVLLQWKMLVVSSKSNLTCVAGCIVCTFSWSDHGRIMPRIGNDVSYVKDLKQSRNVAFNFAWQAHDLVRLDRDTCCSAHCKWRFICDED